MVHCLWFPKTFSSLRCFSQHTLAFLPQQYLTLFLKETTQPIRSYFVTGQLKWPPPEVIWVRVVGGKPLACASQPPAVGDIWRRRYRVHRENKSSSLKYHPARTSLAFITTQKEEPCWTFIQINRANVGISQSPCQVTLKLILAISGSFRSTRRWEQLKHILMKMTCNSE